MEISLHNRQRKVRFSLQSLRGFAPFALEECLKHQAVPDSALPGLAEVEVSFVSDATIARVHLQFMNIPEPTDVITFDHGEIVISTETAQANADTYRRSLHDELALYIVHGLLHLNGFSDKEAGDAARMREVQEQILASCLARS